MRRCLTLLMLHPILVLRLSLRSLNAVRMRLLLLSLFLFAGCATASAGRQSARIDDTPRTEAEQQEQSRADLATLLARAKAMPADRQGAPAPEPVAQEPAPAPAPMAVDPFDDLLPAGHIAAEVLARFIAAGPQHLLRSLETEPARQGGRLVGFRIVALAPEAAFLRRAQLLPGDIITSVNGSTLLTPDEFMKVWSGLPSTAAIELSLLRGTETISRRWTIDAAAVPTNP